LFKRGLTDTKVSAPEESREFKADLHSAEPGRLGWRGLLMSEPFWMHKMFHERPNSMHNTGVFPEEFCVSFKKFQILFERQVGYFCLFNVICQFKRYLLAVMVKFSLNNMPPITIILKLFQCTGQVIFMLLLLNRLLFLSYCEHLYKLSVFDHPRKFSKIRAASL